MKEWCAQWPFLGSFRGIARKISGNSRQYSQRFWELFGGSRKNVEKISRRLFQNHKNCFESEVRRRLSSQGAEHARSLTCTECSYLFLILSLCRRLSGPDPLRFLCVALRIEISTRCVFCVAGRIFIGFFVLTKLIVLKLNLNMPKRLRVEAAYRSKTLAYCGSNPRFETSGPANSSTKMAYFRRDTTILNPKAGAGVQR